MALARARGLIAPALALALALTVAACAAGRQAIPPDVRLSDLRPAGGGLFEQRFLVDLRVVNPNDFDLDVDAMTFDLQLNGQPFASGVRNQPVTIPRLGETVVTVEASTGILELARQLLSLADSGDLAYRLSGTVYLNRLVGLDAVPYEKAGNLGLPGGGLKRLIPLS